MTNAMLRVTIFALTLHATTGCGGHYVGSGNITSPNFPNKYTKNIRCTWTFTATAEHHILLRLINLDTEQWYDYIYAYKGIVEETSYPANYLRRYSGQINDSSYYSESRLVIGPTATVVFFSDSSVEASGFRIEFTSVNITHYTDCGGFLYGAWFVESPNYPSTYPLNSHCLWTIRANPGKLISLRIINFDTEYSYDYVSVFDGTTMNNFSLIEYAYRYSGRNFYGKSYFNGSKVILTGPSVTLHFTSDSSISASGFQIEYGSADMTPFTDCGNTSVGGGIITSPDYPNKYPLNSRCLWTLIANPGKSISLRIIDIDTEESYDYVAIRNGTSMTNSSLYDYPYLYSGSHNGRFNYNSRKPLVIGPSATILFISDSSFSAPGFKIEYTSIDLTPYTGCGGDLFGEGNITSPDYPSYYPRNCRCFWTITASPGKYISLRIIAMDIEAPYDNIYVFNGTGMTHSSLDNYSYHYTGTYHEDSFFIGSKVALSGLIYTILFTSDSSITSGGFQIEFNSFDLETFTGCGGSLFGAGNITSPNYPNQYPMNSRCTWTLHAYPGSFIVLRIISMDIEYSHDYVYVYNGTRLQNLSMLENSKLLRYYTGSYYGSNYQRKTVITGPTTTIEFISDSTMTASGFQIEYTSVDGTYTGCGGRFSGSGNITSPNYPNQYPMNSYCTWTLDANPGSFISLRVISLDTEYDYDYLTVNYGTESSNAATFYFTNWTRRLSESFWRGSEPILTGPRATVVFVSDSSVSASGFQIEFTSVPISPYTGCGGSLYGEGNITSPNFPNEYPRNCRCTWTLTVKPGSYISLRVISMDTEYLRDYVLVYNETGISHVSLSDVSQYLLKRAHSGSYYGSQKPYLIGSTATIIFISDPAVSASGFQIEYAIANVTAYTDCGGSLTGSGNITSPNYPNLYPMNSRCTWTLAANPGSVILLRMIRFETESDDYLIVFNVTNTENFSYSNFVIRYSGQYNDGSNVYGSKPIATGQGATIEFFSDFSESASGFQMEYTSVDLSPYTGCGGSFFGAGIITSPNYPNQYPLNSRCTWKLTANHGSYVTLRMISIDTESSYDYIYVFNGTITSNSSLSNYLNRYSGRNSYDNYSFKPTIIGASATIVFISDTSVSASGFQIEYANVDVTPFTDCGGSLFGAGNITSPNYSDQYPMNCRCTWTLTASPGRFILIRIISMDTEISYDYVYVFNGTKTSNSSLFDYVKRYSGRDYNGSYYNSTKSLLIEPSATIIFISDFSKSAAGFQIEYTSVAGTPFTGCGGSLSGAGNVTSPNYPKQYPMNCRCTWTLTASPGSFISLRIISMDTEASYDYVYVFNGTRTSNSSLSDYLKQYSGRDYYGRNYYSSQALLIGPSATIIFTSDYSVAANGFQIEFSNVTAPSSSGCGRSLSGEGNITSPNYPNLYPMNSRCTWTLTANPGSFISIRIISVDTEASYDYIYVFNGTRTYNSSLSDFLKRYSGRDNNGNSYNSSQALLIGPSATIIFISDSSIAATGFQIEYASVAANPYAAPDSTASNAAASEGKATTAADTATPSATTATATAIAGSSESLAGTSTAAGTSTTSESPVKTVRRCKLRRNTTASALPNA